MICGKCGQKINTQYGYIKTNGNVYHNGVCPSDLPTCSAASGNNNVICASGCDVGSGLSMTVIGIGQEEYTRLKKCEQENEELRDKYAKLNDFEQSQCAKLLMQNQQLQAQAARMKEAMSYVLYHLKRGGESWIINRLEPALSAMPTDYHNHVDEEDEFGPVNLNDVEPDKVPKFRNSAYVEALKQAREALSIAEIFITLKHSNAYKKVHEALAAIDKAVGQA